MAGSFVLTFDVDGDVQLERSLSRFGDSMKDYRPAFEEIVKSFYEIEKKQFGTEGGYGSGGWEPLSPRYAEWKAKHYPGKPIMQQRGDLMQSLTGQTGQSIKEIKPLVLRLGTNLGYAVYHQSTKPRTKLPRRPLIELTEADKTEWVKEMQKYLVTEIKKAGLK